MSQTYRETINAVKGGNIAPVYLLAGGDAFLEDYFISAVVTGFLPPGSRKQTYSLDDDKIDAVLAELSAYGLFQERQMLVVRQAQRVSGSPRDELLGYVAKPMAEKCLLLVLEDFQPSKGLHKRLARELVVIDTRPPFPDQLRVWAGDYARGKGYTLSSEALDLLLEYAGDSVGHIVSELGKVFTVLDKGATVDVETIQSLVGADRIHQLWHLQQAVARRESAQALAILVSLLEHGTQPSQIINGIAALFCQLLYIQSRTTAERVYTGLNKVVTGELGRMAQRYPAGVTARVLRMLLATDLTLKSTSVDTHGVLIALVSAVCRERV
ncbi:MAG: DNA polymerase III subunit delta [Candidatus Neomarinimicrobiota bacterium]